MFAICHTYYNYIIFFPHIYMLHIYFAHVKTLFCLYFKIYYRHLIYTYFLLGIDIFFACNFHP